MHYSGTRWAERLNYLAEIEDGWYEGYGEAIPETALNKADEVLHLLATSPNFHVPGIYPLLEDGIVGMEWSEVGQPHFVSFGFTKDLTYEIFSMNSEGHPDDDILIETRSFEEAMNILRECLLSSSLLTRCATRD